jgi:hypothetical protein
VIVRDPYLSHRYGMRVSGGQSDLGDLFAVNPIRRSAAVIAISLIGVIAPLWLLHGDAQTAVLLITGWLGSTGVVLCTPILIWSLLEEAWLRCQRRLWPTVDQLDLSPRAHNLLRRHGFVTITSVEQTPDQALLLLSNMDGRTLHEIRRGVSLWHYRRWQERGFR